MERERERELYLVDRERTRVLAQDLEHAQQTIEWLRVTAGAQLAEDSRAVAQMSQQMALVQSRFAGEQTLHQASWERRLALAQAEWGSQCERLRAECGSSLREAEELLALRAEEASVAKAEKELLEAQLDFARRVLQDPLEQGQRHLAKAAGLGVLGIFVLLFIHGGLIVGFE